MSTTRQWQVPAGLSWDEKVAAAASADAQAGELPGHGYGLLSSRVHEDAELIGVFDIPRIA